MLMPIIFSVEGRGSDDLQRIGFERSTNIWKENSRIREKEA